MAYGHSLYRALRIGLGLCVALMVVLSVAPPASAKDRLVIGMTQFPSTLHPHIGGQV